MHVEYGPPPSQGGNITDYHFGIDGYNLREPASDDANRHVLEANVLRMTHSDICHFAGEAVNKTRSNADTNSSRLFKHIVENLSDLPAYWKYINNFEQSGLFETAHMASDAEWYQIRTKRVAALIPPLLESRVVVSTKRDLLLTYMEAIDIRCLGMAPHERIDGLMVVAETLEHFASNPRRTNEYDIAAQDARQLLESQDVYPDFTDL